MALTPEQVKNQTFTITKFRDGYDPDQVDDFLDEVVADFEAREAEKAQLEQQIASLTAQLEQAKAAPAAPAQPAPSASDAEKSSGMLQLALELHDKHIREGEAKREQLISEGEAKAKTLIKDAEKERADLMRVLGTERASLEEKIKNLRDFEKEYRDTLTSYIQAQLRNLDNSNEPAGAPEFN